MLFPSHFYQISPSLIGKKGKESLNVMFGLKKLVCTLVQPLLGTISILDHNLSTKMFDFMKILLKQKVMLKKIFGFIIKNTKQRNQLKLKLVRKF